MLDTIFRSNGSERRGSEADARDLLAELKQEAQTIRAERQEFLTQFEKVSGTIAKIGRTNKLVDELADKAEAAMRKVAALEDLSVAHEGQVQRSQKLEARLSALAGRLEQTEKAGAALDGPEGPLHKQRLAVEDLAVQVRESHALLASLTTQNADLQNAHARIVQSSKELRTTLQGLANLKGEFGELRKAEADIKREVAAVREAAQQARTEAGAAAGAADEASRRFESLAALQEAGKDTEKRIASLHALAEHVSLKTKALEVQRHAIDQATAEAARLSQIVWTMESQIAKLAEGQEKMHQAEDAIQRIEQTAQAATQEALKATAAREAFEREAMRSEAQARTLLDGLRATLDRLAVDKREFEAADERLKALSDALGDAESRMQAVLGRDEALNAMQTKAEHLDKVFGDLRVDTEELARRQLALEALSDQLGVMQAASRRAAAQQESLLKTQADLDAMRAEVAALQISYGEAARLREGLTQERGALQSFVERVEGLVGRAPRIEVLVQDLLGKMSAVEEGTLAARRLADTTSLLSADIERVGARAKFVQDVGERVNALFTMSADVERRMQELTGRSGEIASLAQQCGSLGAQVAIAQQQLQGVASQQERLAPLVAEVQRLGDVAQAARQATAQFATEEKEARLRHGFLTELLEKALLQAGETNDHMRQLRGFRTELERVMTSREELMADLGALQARHRETQAQITMAEAQAERAESMARQIEQRRAVMVQTEKTLGRFEARLADLDRHAEGLEKKIQSLADRETVVTAVKSEVDGIRQLASRSKADLQFVADHRHDVMKLRSTVDDLLARMGDTDRQVLLIESWRKKVEEVQTHARAVDGQLSEVHNTLENLTEQRVVIDDVSEKLARLEFTVQEAQGTMTRLDTSAQEAQTTLRTLQREREVAERVEKSIKSVRARGPNAG